ncbi:hypothetical protein J1614_005791, partial [Plenodomus biglobosus]
MSLQPPFALFILNKQIPNDAGAYVDNSLTRAFRGDYSGT